VKLCLILCMAVLGFGADKCDPSLWDHVYHPDRLQVMKKCMVITGTIVHSKKEKDGDRHIQVKVDPEFEELLNDRNKAAQGGHLVIEPICVEKVTQKDAKEACRGFHSDVIIPSPGARVRVTGSLILDLEKPGHGWVELHPVTSIEVIE